MKAPPIHPSTHTSTPFLFTLLLLLLLLLLSPTCRIMPQYRTPSSTRTIDNPTNPTDPTDDPTAHHAHHDGLGHAGRSKDDRSEGKRRIVPRPHVLHVGLSRSREAGGVDKCVKCAFGAQEGGWIARCHTFTPTLADPSTLAAPSAHKHTCHSCLRSVAPLHHSDIRFCASSSEVMPRCLRALWLTNLTLL